MSADSSTSAQRSLYFSGALLFSIGLLTGVWSAAALTGTVAVAQPRVALIAHLNALLGGLWLIAVGATLPHLSYQPNQQRTLVRWLMIPTWGNWSITLLASFLGVNGLTYTSDPRNNVIAALLQLLVVLPSLAASAYWLRGFRR